eukprot:CAMPEP_0175021332 /NCGR_PEP_ID=MMETSP0005-20121125/14655_1 /TAXON_ID=420556 /ORGANISM="Ochromonas sp., Strain CCMP1393" /LENGTH=31 /DNA_ID= /DNA_START= /DNA_END= /DNA_ORIENTATION=
MSFILPVATFQDHLPRNAQAILAVNEGARVL